jgi:PST family polysaccharide transporter
MKGVINQQTEIAILLALPGLIATMALAPWVLKLFYSSEFIGGIELMQWFLLGCLGQIISWPLGYVLLPLGKQKTLLLIEVGFSALHALLIYLGLMIMSLEGVAIAFFMVYVVYTLLIYRTCRSVINFSWTKQCIKCISFACSILMVAFIISRMLPIWPATCLGLILMTAVTVISIRGLAYRIGREHRLIAHISKFPILKFIIF